MEKRTKGVKPIGQKAGDGQQYLRGSSSRGLREIILSYCLIHVAFTFFSASASYHLPFALLHAFAADRPDHQTVVIMKKRADANDASADKIAATFRVEIAGDSVTQMRGLSGRETLPADSGMLFVLDPLDNTFFWMKGMNFPIDIIFFDEKRTIIEIKENLQPCLSCEDLKAPGKTAYALEINAGLVRKFGIEVGDTIEFGN